MLQSDVPSRVKMEAWYHLTANMSYPLMIVLSTLLMPAMIIRSYQGWFQMLLHRPAAFLASTFSVSSFYLVSQKELFPKTWLRTFLYLPFLMALGIGLTITNTKAVMEALFGMQTSFERTPKYRVDSKKDESARRKKYRKRLGIDSMDRVAIGCYFALTIWYAVDNENYFTVPFLLLFVFGYWYTGLMSLLQGRFERFSPGSEAHTKPVPVASSNYLQLLTAAILIRHAGALHRATGLDRRHPHRGRRSLLACATSRQGLEYTVHACGERQSPDLQPNPSRKLRPFTIEVSARTLMATSTSARTKTSATTTPREISIAHSPDSDDAFMFYGLATNKVRVPGFKFTHTLADIETLNQRAIKAKPSTTSPPSPSTPILTCRRSTR